MGVAKPSPTHFRVWRTTPSGWIGHLQVAIEGWLIPKQFLGWLKIAVRSDSINFWVADPPPNCGGLATLKHLGVANPHLGGGPAIPKVGSKLPIIYIILFCFNILIFCFYFLIIFFIIFPLFSRLPSKHNVNPFFPSILRVQKKNWVQYKKITISNSQKLWACSIFFEHACGYPHGNVVQLQTYKFSRNSSPICQNPTNENRKVKN